MDSKTRLLQERENWRKDRPFGFVAKPRTNKDNSLDLFIWDCIIPASDTSAFKDHTFKVCIQFFEGYPIVPPQVKFINRVFHPNVYEDGYICLDLLSTEWTPSMNIKTILLAVQNLIDTPNINSPANSIAAELYSTSQLRYIKKFLSVLKK
ncbi:ubiquitin-conjugating enzyme E2 I [Nematocida sp. AWRm80]|nr:ubiquitin-conjugating enzyme E2 I [Nematocida sp. AWRm80]